MAGMSSRLKRWDLLGVHPNHHAPRDNALSKILVKFSARESLVRDSCRRLGRAQTCVQRVPLGQPYGVGAGGRISVSGIYVSISKSVGAPTITKTPVKLCQSAVILIG